MLPDPETLSKAGAVLGGAFTAYRYVWPRIQRRREQAVAARLSLLTETIQHGLAPIEARIADEFAEVRRELKTNGGHSIKDAIQRLERENALNACRMRAQLQGDSNGAMFEASADGRWVWVNRPLMNLVRQDSDFLEENGWINVVDLVDRTSVVDEWRHAVKDRREFARRYRLLVSFTKCIWVLCHAWPARGPHGEVVGYFGTITIDQSQQADGSR